MAKVPSCLLVYCPYPECGEKMEFENLYGHMAATHLDYYPFSCCQCKVAFPSLKQLGEHENLENHRQIQVRFNPRKNEELYIKEALYRAQQAAQQHTNIQSESPIGVLHVSAAFRSDASRIMTTETPPKISRTEKNVVQNFGKIKSEPEDTKNAAENPTNLLEAPGPASNSSSCTTPVKTEPVDNHEENDDINRYSPIDEDEIMVIEEKSAPKPGAKRKTGRPNYAVVEKPYSHCWGPETKKKTETSKAQGSAYCMSCKKKIKIKCVTSHVLRHHANQDFVECPYCLAKRNQAGITSKGYSKTHYAYPVGKLYEYRKHMETKHPTQKPVLPNQEAVDRLIEECFPVVMKKE